MPDDKETALAAKQIQDSIIEEFHAIREKLSFGQLLLIGAAGLITVVSAILACSALYAAISAASGGAGAAVGLLPYLKCLLGAIALVIGVVLLIVRYVNVNGEDKKIEGKQAALDALKKKAG